MGVSVSTKHSLKLSLILDMLFHFGGFFIILHYSQLWNIKQDAVRPCEKVASLLDVEYMYLNPILACQKAIWWISYFYHLCQSRLMQQASSLVDVN